MVRQELIAKLKETPSTVIDMALEFNRSQAAIEDDLEHIRTSLRHDPDYQLQMRPALCLLCGYQFSNNKTKNPTKCPECNEQKIRPHSFRIEKK